MQINDNTISLPDRALLAPPIPAARTVPVRRRVEDDKWALLLAREQALRATSLERVAWLAVAASALAVLGISLWQSVQSASL